MARYVIPEGRPALPAAPVRGQRGRHHRACDGTTRLGDSDAHAEKEMAMNEVGRAVERIAIPSERVTGPGRAALFFGDDRDLWRAFGQALPNQALAR